MIGKEKKCISGKNTYDTENEAQRAADLGMYLRNVQLRPYMCLDCHNFHLTSSSGSKKFSKNSRKNKNYR